LYFYEIAYNFHTHRRDVTVRLVAATLTVLSLLFCVTGQEAGTLNVAVQELKGKGLEQSAASIVSDRLRAEMINTQVFRVMERAEMQTVLKEQGFQQSGACDESSCLVEVGQMLGVDRMVAGSVGKVGGFYTISLRVINVATAEILYTVNVDLRGGIEEVISGLAKDAAVQLAESAGGEVRKAAFAGKSGDMYIKSSPSGATVEIDGEQVSGKTPLTLQGVAAGERRIVVRKDTYYGSRTVELQPDDLAKVDIAMQRGKGALKVFTTPADAQVRIDGETRGMTPCKIDELPAGEHTLVCTKDGYFPKKSRISVDIGKTKSLSLTLKPSAKISVSTRQQSARIMVNGTEVGQGSISGYTVAAGDVEIAIESPGFEPWKKRITLVQGAHKSFDVDLTSVFGVLAVNTNPSGASVYLNENKVGTTPYKNARLKPGNYMLKIARRDYSPVKENISIVKDRALRKQYTLKHSKSYMDSVRKANKAIYTRNRWIRRIAFGAGTAIAGGLGGIYDTKASEAFDTYASYKGYEESVHEDNWDAYKEKTSVRNVLYGAAAACSIGFAISIPF
jgi:hypothetical protein